jgi:hypothetical protein
MLSQVRVLFLKFLARDESYLALSQEKEIERVLYILCRASLLFLLLVVSFFCPYYLSMSIV